jgi:glycosyltransferase involved in cell wall biosynthesis
MRLLLINSFLHPRGGDTTLFFEEWAGWEARGVEVIPFAMRHPDNIASPWASRFPSWRSPRGASTLAERLRAGLVGVYNGEAEAALEALIRDVRPDAAHVHHLHRHLTPSVFPALRRGGVRSAWTLHDHELVCPNGLRFTLGSPCFRCQGGNYRAAVEHRCKDGELAASLAVAGEKYAHRALRFRLLPDRLVCPSRFLADSLAADGLDPARVEHVPNLVSVEAEPGPAGANVVFAGRLTAEKGITVLAQMAAALPHVRVDVYGDGPERARLAGSRNVVLHGNRPRPAVHRALALAGVVVVPSLWPENQPYAVLEAQLLARTVVASRIGGIPELIDDGHDGILVSPGDAPALVDAVCDALAAPDASRARGNRARQRVRLNHSADTWFGRMRSVLA